MTTGRPARVMIVDDSAVMRSLLRSVVASDRSLEVAGTAADGASALQALPDVRPDVLLLDVEMPVMDGLVTLRHLRAAGNRVPVIMCSALTQRGGRVTIEALASGASECVAKPAGQANREAAVATLRRDLLPKIHALTCAHSAVLPAALSASGPAPCPAAGPAIMPISAVLPTPQHEMPNTPARVVVMAISTGGPAALEVLLPSFPADFPLPVLIVQHMPELFTQLLAERLDQRCSLEVHEAAEGLTVRAGTVAIAKGNWHLEVRAAHGSAPATLHLHQEEMENHCRPAADVLFRSVARTFGASTLAVVLTGMGNDGLAGCRVLRAAGATVLVQDRASSAVWGMPGAVAGAGLAHRIVPLHAMGPEIQQIVARSAGDARAKLREGVA